MSAGRVAAVSVAGRVGALGSSGPKGSQQETNIERQFKLKECCDLLLAAGYHRARVVTLTPFDRVVGGIVWAMTNSNLDVDIDLLFTENATIGQRIRLSDVLTRVLVKVKCPYALQSHQIQGLDYDRLFPVLQWLVKKAMETRRETGDLMRLQSVNQFRKHYDAFAVSEAVLKQAAALSQPTTTTAPNTTTADTHLQVSDRTRDLLEPSKKFVVGSVGAAYKPKRKFKKREAAVFDSVLARTEATLLEYGEHIVSMAAADDLDAESADARAEQKQRRGGVTNKGLEEKEAAAAKAEAEERKRKLAEHEKRMKDLKSNLESGSDLNRVTGQTTSELIRQSAGLIKQSQQAADAAAAEAAGDATAGGDGAAGGGGGKDAWRIGFERQMAGLQRRIKAEEEKLAAKQAELAALQQKAGEVKSQVEAKAAERERLIADGEKLSAIENTSSNQAILQKLKALVVLNETLKQSEAQFKLNCKLQRAELQAQLKALDDGESADEEVKRMREVERLWAADVDRHQKLRNALAKKNQEISRIVRQIDDIPTRPELLQYERRFVELYELVAAKLKETKKYFDLYNMLSDSYKHMSTEVSVLNSITEGFPKAMKSEKGKASFLESFKEILAGIKNTSDAAEKQLGAEVAVRELRTAKYNQLLEKQRNYFKAVKEFQDECNRNELLQQSVDRFTRAAEEAANGGGGGDDDAGAAAADDE